MNKFRILNTEKFIFKDAKKGDFNGQMEFRKRSIDQCAQLIPKMIQKFVFSRRKNKPVLPIQTYLREPNPKALAPAKHQLLNHFGYKFQEPSRGLKIGKLFIHKPLMGGS